MTLNVVPIESLTPEQGSMMDHALRYAAIGWHVFPVWGGKNGSCRCGKVCKSPGKHPVEYLVPRGQDNATTDPATIRRWWSRMPEAGVAAYLHPSGMVAIDIDPRNGGFDSIDVIESKYGRLQSDVMQFTQGGGEHRLFKLAADNNIQLPGKLGPGIDVKRNGYIVLAPTQGVAGKYDWEASSDPLDGAIPSPLPDWLRDMGAAAPTVEQISASVVRFVTQEQLAELRDALRHIPSDDRDTWVRFGMALFPLGQPGFDLWREWSMKSPKFDPPDQIRVWRSFKPGAINYESIFFEAQQAGWINPLAGSAPPIALPEPVPVSAVVPYVFKAQEETPRPDSLLSPPGILGEITNWVNLTARKPQPQFAVQTAIAFAATVMGRLYSTDQRNWPSLYLLNIGKSASGKEHGKWAIETMLEACGLSQLIGPSGYTSNSGVLSALHRQPSHISVIDEFGKTLEAASIKHSARAASAMTMIMEAWGRNDSVIRPMGYSTFGASAADVKRMEDRSVRNPALTILAMTTPETLFDSIGTAAARDGFLNRFLIVESDIGRQVGKPAKNEPVFSSIVEWAKETHTFDGLANPDLAPELSPTQRVIPIRDDASALFAAFEQESIGLMDQHDQAGLAEMFGRCNEMAMKLALIVAVGCQWKSITAEHASWAIDYVRHYAIKAVNRLQTSVADSEFEATKKQVLDLLRRAGEQGMTERDLNKASRRFSGLDKRGQLNVLDSLSFSGDVTRVTAQGFSGRGQPRLAWVAIEGD